METGRLTICILCPFLVVHSTGSYPVVYLNLSWITRTVVNAIPYDILRSFPCFVPSQIQDVDWDLVG